MPILQTKDWKKLIQLCKAQIKNTKGDKRAARGLLYRLTFYISENRLVKPERRKKQEPPVQIVFGNIGRGVTEEEGTLLSPEGGFVHGHSFEKPAESARREEEKTGEVSQHPDSGGRNKIQIEEGGEKVRGIVDAEKSWPNLEP